MAKLLRVVDTGGRNVAPTRRFPTNSAQGAIAPGAPVVLNTSGSYYVIVAVDGDITAGSDYFVGIAATTGTHSSTANGYVDVYLALPGVVFGGSPKTAGAANTQAEIDVLCFKRVVLDLTAGDWTVDSAAADAALNGVVIVGGDPNNDEIWFEVTDPATYRAH